MTTNRRMRRIAASSARLIRVLPLFVVIARYYDPARGQFLSPDTLVPDAGLVLDYNRYMYVRGNPVKYTDPTGHEPFAPVFDKGSGGGGLLFFAASALTVAAADAVSSDLPHITFGSGPAPRLPSFETPTHKSPTVLDIPLLGPEPRPDYATPGNNTATFQAEGPLEGFSLDGQRSAQELIYPFATKVLQTGGNTLSSRTLDALGLSKSEAKHAIESLKKDLGVRNDFHAKIWSNGDVTDPDTGEVLGNLYDYGD